MAAAKQQQRRVGANTGLWHNLTDRELKAEKRTTVARDSEWPARTVATTTAALALLRFQRNYSKRASPSSGNRLGQVDEVVLPLPPPPPLYLLDCTLTVPLFCYGCHSALTGLCCLSWLAVLPALSQVDSLVASRSAALGRSAPHSSTASYHIFLFISFSFSFSSVDAFSLSFPPPRRPLLVYLLS